MSVENFDGPGLSDQPSIIYGYTDDQEDLHIKELSRSGYGEPGPSPGEIIDRESTKSTLDTKHLEFLTFGQVGVQYDDNDQKIPAVACLWCDADDPAKARTAQTDGSSYLNIRYIASKRVQQALRDKRLKKPHTTTSTLTWPVTARRGSRTCCFFGNRNKRLALASGHADCRVPLAGRS